MGGQTGQGLHAQLPWHKTCLHAFAALLLRRIRWDTHPSWAGLNLRSMCVAGAAKSLPDSYFLLSGNRSHVPASIRPPLLMPCLQPSSRGFRRRRLSLSLA